MTISSYIDCFGRTSVPLSWERWILFPARDERTCPFSTEVNTPLVLDSTNCDEQSHHEQYEIKHIVMGLKDIQDSAVLVSCANQRKESNKKGVGNSSKELFWDVGLAPKGHSFHQIGFPEGSGHSRGARNNSVQIICVTESGWRQPLSNSSQSTCFTR